jgi:hypothetical protein
VLVTAELDLGAAAGLIDAVPLTRIERHEGRRLHFVGHGNLTPKERVAIIAPRTQPSKQLTCYRIIRSCRTGLVLLSEPGCY